MLGDSLQAVELEPGVSSGAFWHEARMLQRCSHDRIVPLHGVAIKVRLDQMIKWQLLPAISPQEYRWLFCLCRVNY